jgi:large subunit ribosomal protein L14e
MSVIEVGRLCVKLAGRDAGKECLIVDVVDSNFVTIDGNTRRRKCNIKHLEILPQTAKLKKSATHEDVVKALADLGFKVEEKKTIAKKKTVKKTVTKKTIKEKVADRVKSTKKSDKPKKTESKKDAKKKK